MHFDPLGEAEAVFLAPHKTAVLDKVSYWKTQTIYDTSIVISKHEDQMDYTKNWDALFDQSLKSAIGSKVFTSPNICWFSETGMDSLSSFFRA